METSAHKNRKQRRETGTKTQNRTQKHKIDHKNMIRYMLVQNKGKTTYNRAKQTQNNMQ